MLSMVVWRRLERSNLKCNSCLRSSNASKSDELLRSFFAILEACALSHASVVLYSSLVLMEHKCVAMIYVRTRMPETAAC